jgi:hypothetical protein
VSDGADQNTDRHAALAKGWVWDNGSKELKANRRLLQLNVRCWYVTRVCKGGHLHIAVIDAWAARGECLTLLPWQAFMISQIGGWRHMLTGLRRFRTAYVEVPRKNGKSTLLAGVGLYFLVPDGRHCLGLCAEQEAVDRPRVPIRDAGDLCGQGEDDVEVLDRQQIFGACLHPVACGRSLAFGAVTVLAGVIFDVVVIAFGAGSHMTTERLGPAGLNG